MRIWDPFREMEDMMRDLHPVLANLLTGGPNRSGAFLPGWQAGAYPRINMAEDADNLYLEALAPGINPETLQLTVQRNTLRIAGEKLAPANVGGGAFYASERSAGRFARTVELGVEVDTDRINAQYTDGLLLITLPKAAAAKPKQIQVAVG